MLATQAAIETLAGRIERAYRLRRSCWYRGCSTARVWETAATNLLQLHQEDPSLPIDPELYVAVQPDDKALADPWTELAHSSSAQRYRDRIRLMVRGLRSELRAEVRTAENRISRGEVISKVLMARSERLSPLGCYIVARRARCDELAERFRSAAIDQHRSCPLYRPASRQLLDPELYPLKERSTDDELVELTRPLLPQSSLN